jgi:formylglycine-generating enzyme required for sulfatase activity
MPKEFAVRLLLALSLAATALGQTDASRTIRPAPAAPRRLALVIGNRDYKQHPLANPVNDANDLAAVLGEIGFDVTVANDLNHSKIDLALRTYAAKVQAGDTALFYFSGHAMEVDGQNYLLPVGFDAAAEEDVKYQAVPASQVQERLQGRGARVTILILDACRDNPYRTWKRGVGGGLAGMSGSGVYVAFAAAPGKQADDNPNERNGRFTKHLLAELRVPGLTIDDVFNRVRTRVAGETGAKQVPFSNTGLIGTFVFRESAGGRPPVAEPPSVPELAHTPSARVNPQDGLRYLWIPPGSFMMGCSPGDSECAPDEKAGHQVTITKGFFLGETPVTQQAYRKVTGKEPSNFKGPNLPVEQVSWIDAQSYCKAIGGRLPTEAEWEYAARAGTMGARYGEMDAIAWYSGNSGSNTHDVAQKQPNTFGLYDMLGNVWHWVSDWYGPYSAVALNDPAGPSSGQFRALRRGFVERLCQVCPRVEPSRGPTGGPKPGVGVPLCRGITFRQLPGAEP